VAISSQEKRGGGGGGNYSRKRLGEKIHLVKKGKKKGPEGGIRYQVEGWGSFDYGKARLAG